MSQTLVLPRTASAGSSEVRREPPLALITLTVMLGLTMAIIDTSIVNVALNTMAGNLGATIDEIGWVATGYILANVIVMPLNGWLTARFGRRNFYATSLAVFTIASFMCASADNVWLLVFYRVVQGFGGGALQPTAQAILFESYPPERRAGAMAIFGLGAMVGPAIGPVLGGYIIDNFSWPLIFYINVPIGIVAFIMTLRYIRDPSYVKRDRSPIDVIGLALLVAGLASLQYVLERGQTLDWFSSDQIVVLTVASVVCTAAFVIRELRDTKPLVDIRVFCSRAFTAGNLLGVVSGFGLYGTALILPLFLQNVLGFTPTDAGIAMLPGALATALSMPLASRFVHTVDSRIIIAVGLAMFAAGSWWMGGLDQYAGYWDVFWPRCLQGLALGFIFVPLTTATLAEIPNARMAGATGVFTLVRQLGGSLGIAILILLQTRYQDAAYAGIASTVTLSHPAVAGAIAQGVNPATIWGLAMTNATVISYDNVLRLCGIVFALSIPLVFLLGRSPGNTRRAAAPE